MMSLWDKIVQKKWIAIAAAGAAVATVGAYIAYKQYKQQCQQEAKDDIKLEIEKLKSEVDTENLQLKDVEKIFKLVANYAKNKSLNLSNKYKQQRRKNFPKQDRFGRMGEYMKQVFKDFIALQKQVVQLQKQQNRMMASFGLNQQKISQYVSQLKQFMQTLLYDENITLGDTKAHILRKAQYLQTNGEKIILALQKLCPGLSPEEKKLVPIFLNTIICDEVFENEPKLDQEEFDLVIEKYRNYLTPQLIKLESALIPLTGRLQIALRQTDEDETRSPGFDEQLVRQQLELIRVQDPQAFEQIMASLKAQTQR